MSLTPGSSIKTKQNIFLRFNKNHTIASILFTQYLFVVGGGGGGVFENAILSFRETLGKHLDLEGVASLCFLVLLSMPFILENVWGTEEELVHITLSVTWMIFISCFEVCMAMSSLRTKAPSPLLWGTYKLALLAVQMQ